MNRLVPALVAVLLVSCSPEQVASGPNVVARWKACQEQGGMTAGRTILEKVAWIDGKLLVSVKDTDKCGGTRISNPSYALAGNRVTLSWTWELGPQKAVTACDCDHAVSFELANVPPGDYQVQLARAR